MGEGFRRGRVVEVLSPTRLIINKGTLNGVRMGQRYLLYKQSDKEIVDPVTGKRLGQLEIPKGTGKVINVEPHWAMVESDTFSDRQFTLRLDMREEFTDPEIGDLVKPV